MRIVDEYTAVRVLVGDWPSEVPQDLLGLTSARHWRLLSAMAVPTRGRISQQMASLSSEGREAIRQPHPDLVEVLDPRATSLLAQPFDVLDAGRMGIFSDPSGAVFCVWQAKQHNGAQLVNEPGTWNFSDLNTRDVDNAKAFYDAVFGWVTDTFTGGGMEFTMLRLPGYGDFLEQRDPDRRTRQEEINAPPGFEDVVAGLLLMTSDRFSGDVPAHWSVTFTVDDTDAMAGRAAELGGTVMAPPLRCRAHSGRGIARPSGRGVRGEQVRSRIHMTLIRGR